MSCAYYSPINESDLKSHLHKEIYLLLRCETQTTLDTIAMTVQGDLMMLKEVFRARVVMLLGLCCGGCNSAMATNPGPDFPTVLPIQVIEHDENVTIFDRKDLQAVPTDKLLIVPLYRNYKYQGTTDAYAIAHPFIYQQGADIENKLAAIGERDNLRRLILWIPGYFPCSVPRTYRHELVIKGKQMTVVEAQRCTATEEQDLNAAMKTLLQNGNFVVGKMLAWKVRPPYSNTSTRVDEHYDFARLVRAKIYQGRFFKYGCATDYLLWTVAPETKIINRLTPEDKKIVAAFAGQAQQTNKNVKTDARKAGNKDAEK